MWCDSHLEQRVIDDVGNCRADVKKERKQRLALEEELVAALKKERGTEDQVAQKTVEEATGQEDGEHDAEPQAGRKWWTIGPASSKASSPGGFCLRRHVSGTHASLSRILWSPVFGTSKHELMVHNSLTEILCRILECSKEKEVEVNSMVGIYQDESKKFVVQRDAWLCAVTCKISPVV